MEKVENREQAVEVLQEIGRTLYQRGLVNGAEGNISLRAGDGTVYISARGSRLGALRPEDVAHITTAGQSAEPGPEPTSEYLLHTLVYESCPELGVVLHTHSPHATAVAVNRENVPPLIDEMTILLGGGIGVAPYAAPGTMELAQGAAQGLRERKGVLLANHGAVVGGTDPADALKLAELVEQACRVFLLAKGGGTVHTIPPEAFERQREIYEKKRGR
ncbi:MAG: class II aldolase/adducin family protein [Oscillospiraceae bacterium]|nr:class II aldolase/adducin family protein [Oscillospiraceae bacterium]